MDKEKVHRSRRLRKKTKLSQEQFNLISGSTEAFRYEKTENGLYVLNLKKVRALAKAWAKSPKFVLLMEGDLKKRYYLTKDNALVTNTKEAIQFAWGFDDPVKKIEEFETLTKLKLRVENIGITTIKKDGTK